MLSGGGGASPAAREDLHRSQQEEDGQLRGHVQYMVQQLDKEMGQCRFDQGGGNHSRTHRTQRRSAAPAGRCRPPHIRYSLTHFFPFSACALA